MRGISVDTNRASGSCAKSINRTVASFCCAKSLLNAAVGHEHDERARNSSTILTEPLFEVAAAPSISRASDKWIPLPELIGEPLDVQHASAEAQPISSRTDLGAPGGEIPPGDSTLTTRRTLVANCRFRGATDI